MNPAPTQHPDATTVGGTSPARTLRDAALYLSRHGWCQYAYYTMPAPTPTPPACAVGAIAVVCYGEPVDPVVFDDEPEWVDFDTAVTAADHHLTVTVGTDLYSFNDSPHRTAGQVIAALYAAADAFDEAHGGDQ
jgi:hypothetical protein